MSPTQGESELATELADARQRASQADESGASSSTKRMTTRKKNAEAGSSPALPKLQSHAVNQASAVLQSGEGQAIARKDVESESPGESLAANLQRQATPQCPARESDVRPPTS